MWQPDGYGWRARIGLIAPHADLVPDAEFAAMAPGGVSVHTTRVRFGGMDVDRNLDEPVEVRSLRDYVMSSRLDEAAELLGGAPLSVIAYAFTSTSYLGGDADDGCVRARIEEQAGGLPVVTTCAAAVHAMGLLGSQRMALIHPPWISGAVNEMGAGYFRRQGFDVVAALPADLPGGQRNVHPAGVYEWVRATVPAEADVIFFGGNGFRVVGTIDALERDLGRPVLSANQVLLWAALGAADLPSGSVTGYGSLFSLAGAVVQERN